MDKLDIYINQNSVGSLANESHKYVFSYAKSASDIVSVTMPLRTESWLSQELHPIFQMNLPEGALKGAIQERFSKIMKMDDLGTLKLIGPYVIGRVKYGLCASDEEFESLDEILNNDTHQLFEALMDKFALRSGVSGVQPKMLLTILDKNTLTTGHYIVKSWGEEYMELALNEFFCMEAIRYAGLKTPEYYLSENRFLAMVMHT